MAEIERFIPEPRYRMNLSQQEMDFLIAWGHTHLNQKKEMRNQDQMDLLAELMDKRMDV